MKDFISIGGQKVELTEEKRKEVLELLGIQIQQKQLSEYKPGEIVKIGAFEMVVLEQSEGQTSLILKDIYGEDTEFGENNNYDGSYVDVRCQEFGKELEELVGAENMIPHEVDLIAIDGLKSYGTVTRRVASITAETYRKFVDILDAVNPRKWWWLATPWSTPRHENDSWTLCVAPSGRIYDGDCCIDYGVRPFCILKSNIFVSG